MVDNTLLFCRYVENKTFVNSQLIKSGAVGIHSS